MFITVMDDDTGNYVVVNTDYIIKVESEEYSPCDGVTCRIGKIFLAGGQGRTLPKEGGRDPNVLYTREELPELEKVLHSLRVEQFS